MKLNFKEKLVIYKNSPENCYYFIRTKDNFMLGTLYYNEKASEWLFEPFYGAEFNKSFLDTINSRIAFLNKEGKPIVPDPLNLKENERR